MAALSVEPAYASLSVEPPKGSLLVERATHPAGPLLISRACLSILDGYEKDCFILEREIESYWEIYIDSSITKAKHRNQRWDRTYLALILGSKPTWHRPHSCME